MYIVNVRSNYDSAHYLRSYKGKCENLHGHRYVAEAAMVFDALGEGGMAYDFTELKAHLRAITEYLDHRNLNELPEFAELDTSAENQARVIFEQLRGRLGEMGEHLLYVRVWETPNQWAQYSERLVW